MNKPTKSDTPRMDTVRCDLRTAIPFEMNGGGYKTVIGDFVPYKEACRIERELNESEKYRLALESLTPQGSEYVRDVERCVKYVRDVRLQQHEQILKLHRELNQWKECAN